ncbi:rod shape-determining protein MreD [Thiohalorhabdus sp.]|uniref:rod shape-determining protein MreD n=1 Tax=Thiohalorhabdus sp. TaxID=3094134 RepID=UPI002FC27928
MSWTGHVVVALSVLIALGLGSIPLAEPASYLWPDWVLLTLAYWSLAAPQRYGVGVAFLTGILQDVAIGTLLGLHALIYVLIVYVLIANHLRIRMLHLGAQTLVILVLALVSLLLQLWVEGPNQDLMVNLWALVPAMTTALFWSPVFLLLRSLRQHFAIA